MKGAKKPRRVEERTVFLLLRQGQIALRKRPRTGSPKLESKAFRSPLAR